MSLRLLAPLAAFVVPTTAIGYGIVIPRSCIAGVNALTIGFATTLLGACVTYLAGVRAARRPPRAFRRPAFIARQSSRPTGLVGRILGAIMARETGAANRAAVRALAVAPNDRVLEVGYGHGRTVELLADAAPGVVVDGVDRSHDMVRAARRRVRRLVAEGRAFLRAGDSARLPHPDGWFDKALAVHTLYFWEVPEAHLRELRRVLAPRGALVLGFTERTDAVAAAFPAETYRFYSADEVGALLRKAGFSDVSLEHAAGIVIARAT